MNIDMEGTEMAPAGVIAGGENLSGISSKPPNEGYSGFMQLEKFKLSKRQAMEWLGGARERIRPWRTFFATARFNVPVVVQRLPMRIVKNVEYFQSNYLFVFIGLFIYCLMTSPFLLIVIIALLSGAYWMLANDRLAVVFGQRLSLAQRCSVFGLCSMPILYIVGAGAALFWVLGASFFLIFTHATFYDIHSLLEPEEGFELTMEQVV